MHDLCHLCASCYIMKGQSLETSNRNQLVDLNLPLLLPRRLREAPKLWYGLWGQTVQHRRRRDDYCWVGTFIMCFNFMHILTAQPEFMGGNKVAFQHACERGRDKFILVRSFLNIYLICIGVSKRVEPHAIWIHIEKEYFVGS